MMLLQLREAFPGTVATWTPGARFACDRPPREGKAALVGELGEQPIDLRLAGRRLVLRSEQEIALGIVDTGVIAGSIGDEDFVLAFSDASTLVGVLPPGTCFEVGSHDGVVCLESGEAWSALGDGDALALLWSGPLFALGYGHDLGEAMAAARCGLGDLPWQQAEQRLAGDCHVTAAPLDDD
ncbi:MAG TPA: hypothetical protein VEL07_09265 [Planctomycetota bacterium]|nr:hypothetical protein [Planctomycetota bacterium]